jgi:hypothetical protein
LLTDVHELFLRGWDLSKVVVAGMEAKAVAAAASGS